MWSGNTCVSKKLRCLHINVPGGIKSENKDCNLVSMSKGKAHIPTEHWIDIYDAIATDFINGNTLPLIEKVSDVRALFIDLDFKSKGVIEDDYFLQVAKGVHGVVKSHYMASTTPEDFESIVLLPETSNRVAHIPGSGECYKNGVHIVFPRVILESDQHKTILNSIVFGLEHVLPRNSEGECMDWSKIIDKKATVSLRMPFCQKVELCCDCRRRANEFCQKCFGTKEIQCEGSCYRPKFYLNGNGEMDESALSCISESTPESIKLALLKCNVFRTPDTDVTDGYRKFPVTEYQQEDSVLGFDTKVIKIRKSSKSTGNSGLHFTDRNSVEWSCIVGCMQLARNLHPTYANLEVDHVKVYKTFMRVDVNSKDNACRYCLNIKRHHTSNRICFEIGLPRGLSNAFVYLCACCFSGNSYIVNGKEASCGKFRSARIPIPKDEPWIDILFPKSPEGKRCSTWMFNSNTTRKGAYSAIHNLDILLGHKK